jgi:hypothetical protein
MNKARDYSFILAVVGVPIIIYFYFLQWQTMAIYGDDINIYMSHLNLHSFGERMNLDVAYGKFRPVHSLFTIILIEVFNKNVHGYYLFNIAVQSLIVLTLAASLNLFLRSPWLSLFLGLIAGLSRFSFFNISQLYNGGALEGLAMVFFLVSLFFMIKVLHQKELTPPQLLRNLIAGVLFANLSMYTHERYIVVFPLMILAILVFPGLRKLTVRQKTGLILGALASIILNILLKKFIYSMPFLMGTAGTSIKFSFSTISSFLADALLSIFQVNSGPDYLVGVPFSFLTVFDQTIVIITFCAILTVLLWYLFRTGKAFARKNTEFPTSRLILLFLIALFFAFLVPAVVTVRLEQRWLQASFSLLVLMLAIALNDLAGRKKYLRNSLLIGLGFLFLWTDYNYLYKGADNLYMANCERIAAIFRQAISTGVIRPNTPDLYMWEKKRDANLESEVDWVLGKGTFFDFYQGKRKKLLYADSTTSLTGFDADSDQIIYPASRVIDITKEYLKDSLKNFSDDRIGELVSAVRYEYDQRHLWVDRTNFNKFSKTGFYPYESGISWTNGKASIGFMGDFAAVDTLSLVLNTYMPPICKDVQPVISVMDQKNRSYQPIYSKRTGDKFTFLFHFDKPTPLQKINISSERINSYPDERVLSFPFVNLEVSNGPSR